MRRLTLLLPLLLLLVGCDVNNAGTLSGASGVADLVDEANNNSLDDDSDRARVWIGSVSFVPTGVYVRGTNLQTLQQPLASLRGLELQPGTVAEHHTLVLQLSDDRQVLTYWWLPDGISDLDPNEALQAEVMTPDFQPGSSMAARFRLEDPEMRL